MQHALHYKSRKAAPRINPRSRDFHETVSFAEEDSVGAFVAANAMMNNPAAVASGILDVFRCVANNGAFFRSAKTRREVNYWLPGLNAGIPFTSKKDEVHEISYLSTVCP